MHKAEDILQAVVCRLRLQARAAGHRATLLLSGEPDWTALQAHRAVAALPDLRATWLSERALVQGVLPLRAADRLLGADLDLLVYDAHSGFDPDGFGAATGAIRGGGLLLLLTPPLRDWSHQADPQAERIAVWPHTAASVGGRFLQRLAHLLIPGPGLIHLEQDAAQRIGVAQQFVCDPTHPSHQAHVPIGIDPVDERMREPNQPDPSRPATPDQERAIAAILAVAQGRAHRPLVIRAHRGRGKSAALGLAAGRLLRAGALQILVTAPRRSAAESLFKHAAAVLAGPGPGPDRAPDADPDAPTPNRRDPCVRRRAGAQLTFSSPAELAADKPPADLLLIDEAAGIPAPLLEALLAHYPRIVFATTVHGYEGTGRGFDVRFRDTLDRLTPSWHEITLDTPIRWAANDPLEALIFRTLLLDAAAATAEQLTGSRSGVLSGSGSPPVRCERLDRDALARDEPTLRELFGLLVLAHYQTRPMDLRMLLDGPNVRVYVIRTGDHIAATLLAAEEGGFTDPALREAIFMGQRRPRGHLLPQTLSTHAGIAQATELRYLRVIRIAVHPACVRQGLGLRLLRCLARDGRTEGFDLLGASFGATPDLVRFWYRCGFRPAQIGTSRNAASGEHALVVLRRLNARGWRFALDAEARLESRLPVLLAGPLRRFDAMTAAALIAAIRCHPGIVSTTEPAQSGADAQELTGFTEGHRSLDATLPLLADLTRHRLGPCLRANRIDIQDAALLIAATRQLHGIADLVSAFNATGRDDILVRIRRAADALRPTQPNEQPGQP